MAIANANRIVNGINRDICDTIYYNNIILSRYEFNTIFNDVVEFAKVIAEELNAIEEICENEYLLLKRNNIYIKIDWSLYPNYNFAIIYTQVSEYLNDIN